MNRYEKGRLLGRGTHGTVHQAKDIRSGQTVAIKKIGLTLMKEGINMTALREVKILRELQDPHVINLLDVFVHKNNLALVFEYMDSDLEMVIKNRSTVLSPADVKAYMKMLLQALQACHKHWIVHRDIKPNNFLISRTGEMKIADFGLARAFGSPGRGLTNQVFARWYRAPELFFGSNLYGSAVDAWAAGCCFAGRLWPKLGTPSEAIWPGVSSLPQYVEYVPIRKPPLRSLFPKISDDALDLLEGLMQFDPRKRLSAEQALKHRYFQNRPLPTPNSRLPQPPPSAHNPLETHQEGSSAVEAPLQPPQDLLANAKGTKRKLDLTELGI